MILYFDVAGVVDKCISRFDGCPFSAHGASMPRHRHRAQQHNSQLYTPEQRRRRDASPWTLVQGILAPLQFAVFLISLALVLRFMMTGAGYEAATVSILIKTLVLYTIMVTGAIWERDVYGQYLFAPAFFWEDAVSMIVIGLHSFYLYALLTQSLGAHDLMMVALAAYAAYAINAAQFLMKLRAARKEKEGNGQHGSNHSVVGTHSPAE